MVSSTSEADIQTDRRVFCMLTPFVTTPYFFVWKRVVSYKAKNFSVVHKIPHLLYDPIFYQRIYCIPPLDTDLSQPLSAQNLSCCFQFRFINFLQACIFLKHFLHKMCYFFRCLRNITPILSSFNRKKLIKLDKVYKFLSEYYCGSKIKRMRWAGNAARIGRIGNYAGFLQENVTKRPRGRHYLWFGV